MILVCPEIENYFFYYSTAYKTLDNASVTAHCSPINHSPVKMDGSVFYVDTEASVSLCSSLIHNVTL